MNPAIIKAVSEAIKAVCNVIPNILAQIGPKAFAEAHLIRQIAKAMPWLLGLFGAALSTLIIRMGIKRHFRIAGRVAGQEIILEEGDSKDDLAMEKRSIGGSLIERTPAAIQTSKDDKQHAIKDKC